MPAAADDPLARFGALGRLCDHRHDLIPARRRHQFQTELCFSDACEMTVPFDESRYDELPLKVYYLVRRSNERLHVDGTANSDNVVATNVDCLCIREYVLNGLDRSFDHHQVAS